MSNHQSMQTSTVQGNGHRPQQVPPSAEWPPASPQPGIPPVQNISPSPVPAPRPPGSGLLSNWKSGAARYANHAANVSPATVAEQETRPHQATPKSVTGYNPGNGATNAPGWSPPYQPGANMSPAMFVPPPQQPAQSPVPVQYPGPAGPYQQLQPMVPMPGTAMLSGQSAWYQPGPSPFMPPPQVGQRPGSKPPQRKKKKRVPVWALVTLSLMLVLLIAGGSVGGYYYFTLSAPISGIVNQQVARLKGDDDPNQGRGDGGSILSGGRINILLLGSDTDEKFNNTYLAQSDIIVTVDPTTKQVGMLSIPRDFWINVPGSGMHKLDEAYGLGGVALSRLTITQDFGIHINYYAWVGLDGFVKVINTVNGIDLDVIHPITDDTYPDDVSNHTNDIYAYQRLYLPPGPQHLTGVQALEYVRSRHADLVGDFGRSARQQQILTQLKDKLNNPGIIEQLPALANDLAGVVKTDMQLSQVFDLMRFARNIDTNKIQRVTLGPPYSSTGTASDGQSVVFPHCDLIIPVIAKMFGSTADARCDITADASNNSSSLASTSQGSPVSNAITQETANGMLQTASQMASISTMSLNGNDSDLLGIHSLLDLLFLVVFESPDAMKA